MIKKLLVLGIIGAVLAGFLINAGGASAHLDKHGKPGSGCDALLAAQPIVFEHAYFASQNLNHLLINKDCS